MDTCTHLDQVEILEPPEDIAGCEESFTGQFLREVLPARSQAEAVAAA